jgi:Arc/MetJ family transcription regulator
MRSTIDIDDSLLDEARQLIRIKTKEEVVNLSLKELISKKRREHLASLFGSTVGDISCDEVVKIREDEI